MEDVDREAADRVSRTCCEVDDPGIVVGTRPTGSGVVVARPSPTSEVVRPPSLLDVVAYLDVVNVDVSRLAAVVDRWSVNVDVCLDAAERVSRMGALVEPDSVVGSLTTISLVVLPRAAEDVLLTRCVLLELVVYRFCGLVVVTLPRGVVVLADLVVCVGRSSPVFLGRVAVVVGLVVLVVVLTVVGTWVVVTPVVEVLALVPSPAQPHTSVMREEPAGLSFPSIALLKVRTPDPVT